MPDDGGLPDWFWSGEYTFISAEDPDAPEELLELNRRFLAALDEIEARRVS